METEKQQPKTLARSKTVWATIAAVLAVLVAILYQHIDHPADAQPYIRDLIAVLVIW